MQFTENHFTIAAGKRPVWKNILLAFMLTIVILALAADAFMLIQNDFSAAAWFSAEHDLQPIGIVIAATVAIGVRKDMTFELPGNGLSNRYHLGVFQITRKENLPPLDYMSVFKNSKDKFEVKLWIKGNRRIEMYTLDDRNQALALGREVAAKLRIDLLDATDGANRHWIEFPHE